MTFFRGNSARSANWMRTLEFAIWEHVQTSALRRHCSHLLTRSLAGRFGAGGRLRGGSGAQYLYRPPRYPIDAEYEQAMADGQTFSVLSTRRDPTPGSGRY